MKKLLICLIVFAIAILGITGCEKRNKEAAFAFKEEYETLNGTTNKSGKEHRNITIDEDNPYIKVSPKKIVQMIDEKETFYLYVGDPLCPWCRSVLEKSIEVANELGINSIYYIDIWDDEGNEILRDKYELKDGKPNKIVDGTKAYYRLLKEFDSLLNDYNLTDEKGNKVSTGEKRIFAPNYFYIEKGIPKKMIEGISEKQTDPREELTSEILKDQEKQFKELFQK